MRACLGSVQPGYRLLGLLLLIALPTAASAQFNIALSTGGPNYLAPGAPFRLSRVTRLETRLQNGSTLASEVRETLSRDPQGRLFDLATVVSSDALKQSPAFYLLADPTSKTVAEWRQGQTQALSMVLPPGSRLEVRTLWASALDHPSYPPSAVTSTEDLGTEEIAGLTATGTRTVVTLPAGAIGNTAPLRIVHEVWLSPTLHLPLRQIDSNPFSGTRTVDTEKYSDAPAEAVLFHLPPGITLKSAGPSTDVAELAYGKAMADIKAPETREAAADVLVTYAHDHPEADSEVAHTLAIRNTHLADAKALAEASVGRLEQTTSALTVSDATSGSFAEMYNLASYWDSLGSVLAALGDTADAEHYFRDAWALGGEGMYLDHIAQIEVHTGKSAAALQDDLVALSGKMNAREADEVSRRAERLGGTQPQPAPMPVVVSVPATKQMEGAADFNLLFTGSRAPAVAWIGGDDALKPAAESIATAAYPTQRPDSGPEHILRRGHLQCTAATGCKLTLLYSWQAEDALNGSVRNGTPTPAQ